MITASTFKFLATQKMKDAECLLKSSRYNGSIYVMGYAIEFALKRRICLTLDFRNGFPENRHELNAYLAALPIRSHPIITFDSIKQIRNHDLGLLLQYSGIEAKILSVYPLEWFALRQWNPESRYKRQRVVKPKAVNFLKNAKRIIIHELL